MTPDLDFVSAKEDETAKKIVADSYFQNVVVLKCNAGDIAAKINEALQKLGLFLLVEVRTEGKLPGVDDNAAWPIWITITENPITNRGKGQFATGKTDRQALGELARLIDETLNIGEATVARIDDPSLNVLRVVGKVIVQISKRT